MNIFCRFDSCSEGGMYGSIKVLSLLLNVAMRCSMEVTQLREILLGVTDSKCSSIYTPALIDDC